MNKHKKYKLALKVLRIIRRKLNIVVVGANDGKINDPIFDFIKKHKNDTQVLLIEPINTIIPYLEKNYSFHPRHLILNCAVGFDETITLYTIKQSYWKKFQPGYAKNWPSYRAASGVTSAFRSHLEKCLTKQKINPNEAIKPLKIPSYSLKTLLTQNKWQTPLDVLQIDAEGYDAEVIFNSDLGLTRPKIIYFESHNLEAEEQKRLIEYLNKFNYQVFHSKGNSLAILNSQKLLSFCIKTVLKMISSREK